MSSSPPNVLPKPHSVYDYSAKRVSRDFKAGTVEIEMNIDEKLCFVGTLRIQVLEGAVEILGFTFTPDNTSNGCFERLPVYSPSWWNVLTMRCSKERTHIKIYAIVDPSSTSKLTNTNDVAGKLSLPGFQVLPNEDEQCTTRLPKWSLHIPQEWEEIADNICKSSKSSLAPIRVLTCGAKGVGKSTFNRYLVNRLLSVNSNNDVAFLETDAGQPELTPPGIVSLHKLSKPLVGPAHTHLQHRDDYSADTCQSVEAGRSYFVGTIVPKTDPDMYLSCIHSLVEDARLYGYGFNNLKSVDESIFEYSQNSLQESKEQIENNVPLVINSHGWVHGMGLDLLSAIIADAMPTHVVQIQGSTRAKKFELPVNISPKYKLLKAPAWSMQPGALPRPPRTAADLRNMRITYYFADLEKLKNNCDGNVLVDGGSGGDINSGRIARSLRSAIPHCVSWENVSICIVHTTVAKEDVLRAINGSLVGLIVSGIKINNRTNDVNFNNDRYITPPNVISNMSIRLGATRPSPCVGLGIVRSIDPSNGRIYILTPIPLHVLKDVDLLLMGDIGTPVELIHDGSCQKALQIPYLTVDSIKSTNAAVMKSRNNLKRRRLQ